MFQPNIPNDVNDKNFAYQVKETLRLILQEVGKYRNVNEQISNLEASQSGLGDLINKLLDDKSKPTSPSNPPNPNSNIIQQQQLATITQQDSNLTGFIGRLAQNQYPYVKTFATNSPSAADQAIQQGSLFYNSANSHLYYCTETDPVTFVDLGSMSLAVGTHAARPAASTSNNNTFYYETDRAWLYYSNGTTWQGIAGLNFGTRATRVAIGGLTVADQRLEFFETDTGWRYFRNGGTTWKYESGIYFSTRATRTGLTLVSGDDDGALFFETDTCLLWMASAGTWMLKSIGAIVADPTLVSVSAAVTTDQILYTTTLHGDQLNTANRTIRITISGTYDQVVGVTLTMWKIKLGGVTILTWTPNLPASTVTNVPYRIQCEFTTVTTGATGNVEAHGVIFAEQDISSGHNSKPQLDLNTAVSGAIDLTQANITLEVDISFNSASSSNVGRKRNILVEVLC